MTLLQAAAKYNDSYATAYIHKLAWTKTGHRNTIVYARIAGKPTFVKAIAGNLYRGNHIRIQFPKEAQYLYGSTEARCLYHRVDKIGIATYFSTSLFNSNSNISYLIGQDQNQINQAFTSILRSKPICFADQWNMKELLTDLQLITEIETYNVDACEIFWDEEKINGHISHLVRNNMLTF